MKDFFKDEPIFASVITLIGIVVILFLIDIIGSEKKYFNGEVLDKHYKAEINSHGSGVGMTSNGQMGVVTTSHHESEAFLIIVENKDFIVTVNSNPSLFYSKNKGDKIECYKNVGCLTGKSYSYYAFR
jgi:hypothetical protein